MNLLSPSSLIPLLRDTLRAPRQTFARLQALNLDRVTLWQALLLVVVVSVLLAEATNMYIRVVMPVESDQVLMLSPFVFGLMQMAILVVTVFLIDWVGRSFRGQGSFPDAILAVVWIQFVMVCLQLVQGLALILIPPLAGMVVLIGLTLFFWLLTNFIAELHGFQSLGRVFGMIVVVLIGVALGLSFLLTLVGVTVPR